MPAAPTTDGFSPVDPVPQLLRDLIHERTGIYFDSSRIDVLLEKLQARLIENRCESLLNYYYLLRYEDTARTEWRRVMDAFSVPETYFWREFDQIAALVHRIVPEWFARTRAPLRIWSAACATGEEPYTIAMALREAGWGDHPIEIHASDASEAMLVRAQAGIFRERSFRVLTPALRSRYFTPVAGGFAIDRAVGSRVTFHHANLVEPRDLDLLASAPVIFCRNVFIYFSPASIRRVTGYLAQRMPADGHLFIGASESLLRLTDEFDLGEIGPAFVYRRRDYAGRAS